MKRIWQYIIGAILLLVTAGSVFLAYSVIVTPGRTDNAGGNDIGAVVQDNAADTAEPVVADAEKNVQLLTRETSYVEKATGIEFPGQIGVFVKTSVRENLNPLFGVSITYQTLDDSPCADIYVYSLDPEAASVSENDFNRACEQTHTKILNMKRNTSVINSVKEIERTELYPAGVYAKWYEVIVKGETIHSHLLMFRHSGKVIKIRVSFPTGDAGDANDALLFERTVLDMFKEKSAK